MAPGRKGGLGIVPLLVATQGKASASPCGGGKLSQPGTSGRREHDSKVRHNYELIVLEDPVNGIPSGSAKLFKGIYTIKSCSLAYEGIASAGSVEVRIAVPIYDGCWQLLGLKGRTQVVNLLILQPGLET